MGCTHWIGGEKGGVGKSVVARLLAQYHIDHAIPFVGFDTDASHATFGRFYREYASPVDTGRFESLDRIAEQALEDPKKTILVDLAAQSEAPLTSWLDESGVIGLLRESGVGVRFWHVMDDGRDSVELLARLFGRFGDRIDYTVVLNHGRGDRFEPYFASETHRRAEELGAAILELPRLHPAAMHKIDQANASFWAAIHNPSAHALGLMDRQRLKLWLARAYAQLERALP